MKVIKPKYLVKKNDLAVETLGDKLAKEIVNGSGGKLIDIDTTLGEGGLAFRIFSGSNIQDQEKILDGISETLLC